MTVYKTDIVYSVEDEQTVCHPTHYAPDGGTIILVTDQSYFYVATSGAAPVGSEDMSRAGLEADPNIELVPSELEDLYEQANS